MTKSKWLIGIVRHYHENSNLFKIRLDILIERVKDVMSEELLPGPHGTSDRPMDLEFFYMVMHRFEDNEDLKDIFQSYAARYYREIKFIHTL